MLRKKAERGEISWEEADSVQQIVLNDYASYFNSEHPEYEANAKSWVSFSKSQVNIVTELKPPIYIAYGSDDITSDFCDLLRSEHTSELQSRPHLVCRLLLEKKNQQIIV